MAANSKTLRALQIIASTSRKIRAKAHSESTPRATPNVPTVLKSLPEHKPLLPLLLSHNIPSAVANACADRYDRCAGKLRSTTEAILVPHLMSHDKDQPASIYSLFLNNYKQALRDWAQSILNAALKSLKRDPAELRDWDIIYPQPLWFPFSPESRSDLVRDNSQEKSPLSYTPAPPYAFPTPYPPPHRPASQLQPVEWSRAPTASSSSPSTSSIDLESLCLQFSKSLVIDENAKKSQRPGVSIFSQPGVRTEVYNGGRSSTKLSKGKLSKIQRPRDLPAPKPFTSASPFKTAKLRQLSVPPSFPSFASKVKPASRKASDPAPISALKRAAPRKSSDRTHRITPTPSSPPTIPSGGGSNVYTCSDPSAPPLYPQSLLDLTLGQTVHATQGFPYSSRDPVTPPTSLSDLFSGPIVVPPAPLHLDPGSSLLLTGDPFVSFQMQNGLFSKGVSDTPLGFDYPPYNLPTTMTSDIFENLVDSYAVF